MSEIIGRIPSIPEYYGTFIDKKVDLLSEPKQCCPFHKEDTPSFSYSAERDVWRCFGACKCGGDVIELHRKNYHLRTRAEADKSLRSIFHVPERPVNFRAGGDIIVNEDNVELGCAYAKACILANTPERWIALDYVMSIYPVNVCDLQELVRKWS